MELQNFLKWALIESTGKLCVGYSFHLNALALAAFKCLNAASTNTHAKRS